MVDILLLKSHMECKLKQKLIKISISVIMIVQIDIIDGKFFAFSRRVNRTKDKNAEWQARLGSWEFQPSRQTSGSEEPDASQSATSGAGDTMRKQAEGEEAPVCESLDT